MGSSTSQPINYSVPVTDLAVRAGETLPRRSALAPTTGELQVDPVFGATTRWAAFERSKNVFAERPCFGTRVKKADGKFGEYVFKNFGQVYEEVVAVGSALVQHNLVPIVPSSNISTGMLGLFSVNRHEWVCLALACDGFKATSVPLYDTLGVSAVEFILNQTELITVAASKDKVPILFEAKSRCPHLKNIIQFEDVDHEQKEKARSLGIAMFSYNQLVADGSANRRAPTPCLPEEYALFCYTSGTTGEPKGAMLTHRALVANTTALLLECPLSETDVSLSYLPLAHVMEESALSALLTVGGCSGFFQGDTLKIAEDAAVLGPTLFVAPPRLLTRVYNRLLTAAASAGCMKASLFSTALRTKLTNLAETGSITHPFWDAVVFKKARMLLGGRVKYMVSGSAPISKEVLNTLRVVFSCIVHEGYGQTETAGGATFTKAPEREGGHVGGPSRSYEVKLVDVPDMNYLSTDKDESGRPAPRGEICFRGPGCFSGYFKDEAKTRETVDSEGWIHSGDVGVWLPNGALKIIDRKKNIFKLAQGEYVAAEKIENVYARCNLLLQSFVYGDSLQSFLVGIIVPDPDQLKVLATRLGVTETDVPALCQNEQIKKALLDQITQLGKSAGLHSFEQVKAVHLEPTAWTPADLLTPTMKLKRNDAKKRYQAEIDAMYAKGLPERS